MFNVSKYIIFFISLLNLINVGTGYSILISRKNFLKNSLYMSNAFFLEDEEDKDGYNFNVYKNNIYFTGALTDQTCFGITEALLENKNKIILNKTNRNIEKHINLHIQSPGGSLLPTLGLVDDIKTLDIPVHTYIRGYAASAATLLSVVGKERYIYKNSVMMIHGLRFGNKQCVDTLLEIKDLNSNVDVFMSIIKNIYKEHSNLTDKQLENMFIHDLWFTSADALKYGLVDKIIY